jgi:hypothetical protein
MEFKRYSSIENSYRTKYLQTLEEQGLTGGEWVVTEKVHGCLDKDTILDTLEHGKITIGEVVERKLSCHVKSHDDGEEVYKKITNWSIQEDIENWYEIVVDNKIILVTGNHLIYIPELKCYRKVEDLTGTENVLLEE